MVLYSQTNSGLMFLDAFFQSIPLWGIFGIFGVCTVIIGWGGYYLTRYADHLADLTGMGEALTGALLLGGTTSLSGIITSVTAAWSDHPDLAASNAIGGIAAQTVFLAIADISYRRSNLEHAAASLSNIMQGALLMVLLSIVLITTFIPPTTVIGVHPTTVVLFLVYVGGFRLLIKSKITPMWKPQMTSKTVRDVPHHHPGDEKHMGKTILFFSLFAVLIALTGYVVARTGISIAQKTFLSETIVGSLFTAIATSLPELVVVIMAVRQNALTLAVGNIIGGNTFDVLFFSFADIAYRDGSLYHDSGERVQYIITLTLLMTSVLVLGLLVREKEGPARIGWESTTVIGLFLMGLLGLFLLF